MLTVNNYYHVDDYIKTCIHKHIHTMTDVHKIYKYIYIYYESILRDGGTKYSISVVFAYNHKSDVESYVSHIFFVC